MSQLSAHLSEARNNADETSQDEQDFVQVKNKRKRAETIKTPTQKQSDQ